MPDGSPLPTCRPETGFIPREIFSSRAVFDREQETLFARAWLFVGHESLIPRPGDYFLSRMGIEPVILCRDEAGEVRVLLNSCRHRGMRVCRAERGNTRHFTCPYHAWSYDLSGRLVGVPMRRQLYEGVLDEASHGLVPAGRVARYKGTVWATWDAEAPDFAAYLGDVRPHLDAVLDHRDGREGGSEVIGIHRWIIPANWKFAAENFLGDTYHNPSHASVDLIGIGPSARSGRTGRRDEQPAQHLWVSFPSGHGVHSLIAPPDNPYTPAFRDDPEAEAHFARCHEERVRRLGEAARLSAFTGTIFPNASYHGRQPRGICVWHPNGPEETEAWRFFLVDADAPAHVKDVLRRYYMRYSGPAGMTEQDDAENWLYATAACRGPISRRQPFNYQQSLGAWRRGDPVPGDVSLQITEQNARNFYRAWQAHLDGAPWPALIGQDT
ncbi:MAG: aromatic ring-hydroxylating dioxygenase subunit alpha [Acetobacteraceae bacterium]|nr:aromatic ring-hydroxylating dioxygenase subunit alpha [Acetobacteraceae bacterium]MCX7683823.1 aromatic ring-hydroxylating dioxygenase subunit alpha [Acetobacteraceae bacterium]MDW8397789.1 aromatic ring-hydroxylating dioxygenase subunit alpha [Acetobacteraceae bacterium]